MARAQTVFSELEVAKSILSIDDVTEVENVSKDDVLIYFDELEKRLNKKSNNISNLRDSGIMMRHYLERIGCSSFSVKWTGKSAQNKIEMVAKDLQIKPFDFRVSVKENANVYINGSPNSAFVDAPNGIFGQRSRSKDWFIEIAYEELQEYFLACGGQIVTGYNSVSEYYKNCRNRKDKKVFSHHVRALHDSRSEEVLQAYRHLCNAVSIRSAEVFNKNYLSFTQSRNQNLHNMLTPIFHFFFKINGVKYFLLGSDKNKPLALIVPSSEEWLESYNFINVKAVPRDAGQPEVDLNFYFLDKNTKEEFMIQVRVEIRWSHGKFCGNPEAKVYKKWAYSELRWVEKI